MKNLVYLISAFLLFACAEKKADNATNKLSEVAREVNTKDNSGGLKVAFYVQDSIATGFTFFRKMDSILKQKQTKFQNKLQNMYADYERYALSAQQKADAQEITGFQLQTMQNNIKTKQENIARTEQQEGAKLQEETLNYQKTLSVKITEAGKEFAKEKGLDALFAYQQGGQITYFANAYDMTEEFVAFLNKRDDEIINGTAQDSLETESLEK